MTRGVNRVVIFLSCLVVLVLLGVQRLFGQTVLSTNKSLLTQSGAIMIASRPLPIGSGFVLGPQKDVVTCWHIWEGARTQLRDTNLLFVSGQGVSNLKLKYTLPTYDLAVFSATPEISGTPFHAGDFSRLNEGDTILYMGYDKKQSSVDETSMEIAYAWAIKKVPMTNAGVKVDTLFFAGDTGLGWSGGPVFNTNLEVVAVIVGLGGTNVVVAHSIAPILEYEKMHSKTNARTQGRN
jgi:S1-C subfamily serine protease